MDQEAIKSLESTKIKLFRIFAEELTGHAQKRYDYDDLANRLHCSRTAIRYNVGKLLSAGLIGSENGKIYLKIG